MATWNTDKPVVGDQLISAIPYIEENFQELKDVIEAITNGSVGTTEPEDFEVDVITMGGSPLQLDGDHDTHITADTDSQIDVCVGNADQFSIKDGVIEPTTDNDIDLGSSTKAFKNFYLQGNFVHNTATQAVTVSSPSASSSVSVSISAGVIYRINYCLTTSDDDDIEITFNEDGGSNYGKHGHWFRWCSAPCTEQDTGGNTGATSFYLQSHTTTDYFMGQIILCTLPSDNTGVLMYVKEHAYAAQAPGYDYGHSWVGYYNGAAEVTSMEWFPGTGTITGSIITQGLG